jgi:DNA-directed RNA polymerase subunit M/transcription elongation factor TFIIS
MDGGFVTANCSECGSSKTNQPLKEAEFKRLGVWVGCPRCSKCMEPVLIATNYVFACKNCGVYIKLASLLPRAEKLL